jgi:3-deoxy-manno-octulosonate cytidylyltransferase (CMP-KDO synthetase)
VNFAAVSATRTERSLTTLAVIPARLGSTRLPRKPLRLLAGLPLVVRVWQRVVDLGIADHIVVATDSEEIADVIASHGGEVVMTRDDHESGTHRVAEVSARPEFAGFGVIVNVQGDEPFVSRDAIIGATHMVTDTGFPLGTAAVRAGAEVLHDPAVVKLVAADDGRALYFSRAGIPFLRDPAHPRDAAEQRGRIWQHIGVYAYDRAALARWAALPPSSLEYIERLEQLRPLTAGIPIGVALIDEPFRPGIDTEADLERANRDWLALSTG